MLGPGAHRRARCRAARRSTSIGPPAACTTASASRSPAAVTHDEPAVAHLHRVDLGVRVTWSHRARRATPWSASTSCCQPAVEVDDAVGEHLRELAKARGRVEVVEIAAVGRGADEEREQLAHAGVRESERRSSPARDSCRVPSVVSETAPARAERCAPPGPCRARPTSAWSRSKPIPVRQWGERAVDAQGLGARRVGRVALWADAEARRASPRRVRRGSSAWAPWFKRKPSTWAVRARPP